MTYMSNKYYRGREMMIDKRNPKPKHDHTCGECHKPKPCPCTKPPACSKPCTCEKPCHPVCTKPKKWNALDPTHHHPQTPDATVVQEENTTLGSEQKSIESIIIKDSCDVEVSTTETQAAVNVQVTLQLAIALVISVSIADSSQADAVTQDLFAELKSSQMNRQRVYIENSRGVNVTTTDTDIVVNVQVLLQVLIALLARLDVL